VPVAVSGGALSLHQGGGEDAHPARSAHISEGKLHDVHALDLLLPEPGATYVMDRGYVDFARLHLLHQAGAFFVTRAKSNLHAHRLYTAPTDRASDIICDPSHWMVTTPKKDYPETSAPHPFQGCRHRQDAGVPHQPIRLAGGNSALYKSRWQVELFFKWIKQHLRIKQFYGTSEKRANLDRGFGLRARRHRQKAARSGPLALHFATDSLSHPLRENAYAKGTFRKPNHMQPLN
jgi:hypothetical protein